MPSLELWDRPTALAVLAVGVLLFVLGELLRHRRTVRWFRRGHRAEDRADVLLGRLGYSVVTRQPAATVTVVVDGEAQVCRVRADRIVERAGRRSVVEVKSGRRAPDPTCVPTRRQLLEYQLAFAVDAILLVDVERRRVRVVSIESGPPRR